MLRAVQLEAGAPGSFVVQASSPFSLLSPSAFQTVSGCSSKTGGLTQGHAYRCSPSASASSLCKSARGCTSPIPLPHRGAKLPPADPNRAPPRCGPDREGQAPRLLRDRSPRPVELPRQASGATPGPTPLVSDNGSPDEYGPVDPAGGGCPPAPVPGVQADVMVISSRRKERRLASPSLGNVKAEHAVIERQRQFEVRPPSDARARCPPPDESPHQQTASFACS